MTLLRELHRERKKRLVRLGIVPAPKPQAAPVPEPPDELIEPPSPPPSRRDWMTVGLPPHEVISTAERILRLVCAHFKVDRELVVSPLRTRELLFPRQISMFLMRKFTSLSWARIAEKHGRHDHSTVIHAVKRIRARCAAGDRVVEEHLAKLTAQLSLPDGGNK